MQYERLIGFFLTSLRNLVNNPSKRVKNVAPARQNLANEAQL